MVSLELTVGFRDSDITFDLCGWCPAGAAVAAKGRRAGYTRRTGPCVEQRAPNEEEGRRPPAQVEGRAQLSLVWGSHVGVIEIPDDGVGSPADGNKVEEPRDGKQGTSDAGHASLKAVLAYAFGALDPHHT